MTGSDSPEFDNELVEQTVAELERIGGTNPHTWGGFSFELRITSSQDPIEFLRSVPSGTPHDEIQAFADAYTHRRCSRGSAVRDGDPTGSEYWIKLEIDNHSHE